MQRQPPAIFGIGSTKRAQGTCKIECAFVNPSQNSFGLFPPFELHSYNKYPSADAAKSTVQTEPATYEGN